MSQKIQILPERLCNQIAAGEVVERPASVVKELLENSLDSGATEICVEVEKGGKRLIRIIDDGCGMGKDDAFLALERHATSKIRNEQDLFDLHTLGFRGEALPSIASVSRFTLRSREESGDEGWEIYAEGGTVRRAGALGLPCGTTIEVRDLFFNTPARRKFLRRDETEMGHVADIVTKLALAHPEVQFRLVHNGRALLELYRQAGLRERVAAVLGRPLLADMVTVEAGDEGGLSLTGLASQPAVTRSSTGSIYTFINGRFIRDRVVQHAILEGYRHLLVKGRYPVVVVFLEMDPEQVDVNVHPAKHEVRFRDQSRVHDFIAATVREALRPARWLEEQQDSTEEASGQVPAQVPGVVAAPSSRLVVSPENRSSSESFRHGVREALEAFGRSDRMAEDPSPSLPLRQPAQGTAPGRPAALKHQGEGTSPRGPFAFPAMARQEEAGGMFSSMVLIGQYHDSYILCQDGADLVLVDQHAAHERIGFESLRRQFYSEGIERQSLLFPQVIEVDFQQSALLKEHLDELEKLGFEVEPFGGKAFALKAVPRLLSDADAEALILDVASEVGQVGKSGLVQEALDDVLIRMACHGVIRANRRLARPEIEALLRNLDRVDFKGHCPHGRPVVKRISLTEVERMFKRT